MQTLNHWDATDCILTYAQLGPVSKLRAQRAADVFSRLTIAKQNDAIRWIRAQAGDLVTVADRFVHKLTITRG